MATADRLNNLLGFVLATGFLLAVLIGSYETRTPPAALHSAGEIVRTAPAG
jgi:hypothetical protein